MCKYCGENISKREKQTIGTEKTKAEVYIIDDDRGLEIILQWFDELRNATMATAALIDIDYCPWCGRKLINV